MPETNKVFTTYADAYNLYADIVSGRDPDRKNAAIFYDKRQYVISEGVGGGVQERECFIVVWEKK